MTPEIKAEMKVLLEELTGREITDDDDYLLLLAKHLVGMKRAMKLLGQQADETSGRVRHLGDRYNQRNEW